MTKTPSLLMFFATLLLMQLVSAQYEPPQALVEPLKPKGIRISIPHEEGISLVAFHVKFNEEFYGLEAGTIARDITRPKNGRWTYMDKTTQLKREDVVYYWIHVIYKGLGYNLLDQQHVVTDFYDYEGRRIEGFDIDIRRNECGERSLTKLFDSKGASRNPCAGDLLLDENFRDGINRTLWTVMEQFSDPPDYEFVIYRDLPALVTAKDGLKISPKLLSAEFDEDFVRTGNMTLKKCTGHPNTYDCYRIARGWNILPPVSSGRINTNGSLNFLYGRVQVRAKLPRGDWIYPLLMLEPSKKRETLASMQLRIGSSSGNANLKTNEGLDIGGRLLWGGLRQESSSNVQRTSKRSEELWSDNFHVYELIWSEDKAILKVDGQKYGEETLNVNIPSDISFYLTIGLGVGGIQEFPDNTTSQNHKKPWRNSEVKAVYNFFNTSSLWSKSWKAGETSLEVDWIKVWAL